MWRRCAFCHIKLDDVIDVDIELDELDLTSAESKATYAEIKDYVFKEYVLKVLILYVSQKKTQSKKITFESVE